MIYVIGCTPYGEFTPSQTEIIKSCNLVIVKTSLMEGYLNINKLAPQHITLDDIFKKSRNFDTLNKNIVKQILNSYKEYKDIAYILSGSGYEDSSVILLKSKFKDLTILPAQIKAAQLLCQFPSTSYTIFSAFDFINESRLAFSKSFPLIIYEISDNLTAGGIKLKLLKHYKEDTTVYCTENGKIIKMPLYMADRLSSYNENTSIILPPQKLLEQKRFDFADLVCIMEMLRGEGGCPWDRQQTHDSIKANAVEEAYELYEAIENQDYAAMEEESGDLLLQTVFHASIAKSCGEYDISDVITALCKKLIFRHSHIFGDDIAKKASDALITWEKNKSIEKNQTTVSKTLKDVARTLPALMRCQKVQKKAAKVGFDFEDIEQIYQKLFEELDELKQALKNNDNENITEECGDLLFAAVNVVRRIGIDAEQALGSTTDKFIRRFEYLEQKINLSGKKLEEVTLGEMEHYYKESKKLENKSS
ncbi:MAG: nucleoside triphosphate pyrophosphohydrolase [Clostridia bacterium]|nr:nucleoside triphosphate pyrophosphohydrolase [Clostridia bacterium]